MFAFLVSLAVLVARTTAKCSELCHGDCCFFQKPEHECDSCDESWTCNPSVRCYYDPSARHAADGDVATESDASSSDGVCMWYCTGSCCGFSMPWKECSACNATMGCHPSAECYDTGFKGQPRPKHAHTPAASSSISSQESTTNLQRAIKKHTHAPQRKAVADQISSEPLAHQHKPGPKAVPAAPRRHQHAPQKKGAAANLEPGVDAKLLEDGNGQPEHEPSKQQPELSSSTSSTILKSEI